MGELTPIMEEEKAHTALYDLLTSFIEREEKAIDKLKEDIVLIKTNHLAHITEAISKLEVKVQLILWVLGIIGTLIITNFFKK